MEVQFAMYQKFLLILVLENGRIIESGTHDSLVKNKGYYYEVYKTQFGDFNVSKEAI